jgi:hypothetical protein
MNPTHDLPKIAIGGTNVQGMGYTLSSKLKNRMRNGKTIYQRDKKIEKYKYSKGKFV